METVKEFLRAGVPFRGALLMALATRGVPTFVEFCARRDLSPQDMSRMVSGRSVPTERQLAALIGLLGGTRRDWLDAWFAAARRRAARAPEAAA